MKKRHLILPTVILAWLLICGVAFGFMVTRTSQRENQFVPAIVKCEMETTMNDDETAIASAIIENTGTVDAYIRVRVVSYWVQKVDREDQIAAKASKMPNVDAATVSGWRKGSEDTFYYVTPVKPKEKIEFLKNPLMLETENAENPSDPPYRQVVEFFAEAIQSNPQKASEESWGITIAGSGNPNIVTVP